eukprot:108748_1
MQQNNGWTASGDVTFGHDSISCISGLCTKTTRESDTAWIRRSTAVSNYQTLRIRYSVATRGLESEDECRVYYSYTSSSKSSSILIDSQNPPDDGERYDYPNNG